MKQSGVFSSLSKKEALYREKDIKRLAKSLDGIKNMTRLPDAIFVVDPVQELTAVTEARRMEIPIVSICDTNCDPDLIDYPMPGNDDAIRSVRLFCKLIADTILEGKAASKAALQPAEADGQAEQEINLTDEAEPAAQGHSGRSLRGGPFSMADISSESVAKLRAKTGAGLMDCKRALTQTGGDFDKAVVVLREQGAASAAKRADRVTGDGLVTSYVDPSGKTAVLLELNCETDFVARTEDFQGIFGGIDAVGGDGQSAVEIVRGGPGRSYPRNGRQTQRKHSIAQRPVRAV
jgi:hypothetical protein